MVCVVLAMVLSLPRFIEAIVMMDPTVSVPVNRLIINTTKYIKAHPKDSQGYYLLGRLHSFAFAGNTHTEESKYSRLFGPNALPEARFIEPVPRQERAVPGKILPAAARWHLNESLRNYQRATELQPKQPLAYLGLGWMLEQGALFADQVDASFRKPAQRASAQEWRAEALAVYRNTVLRAAEDVENALSGLAQTENDVIQLQDELQSLVKARDLAEQAYRAGSITLTDVLDANRQLLVAQDELDANRAGAARAAVGVFRALGGGWDSQDHIATRHDGPRASSRTT